jgi:hypothetical protein
MAAGQGRELARCSRGHCHETESCEVSDQAASGARTWELGASHAAEHGSSAACIVSEIHCGMAIGTVYRRHAVAFNAPCQFPRVFLFLSHIEPHPELFVQRSHADSHPTRCLCHTPHHTPHTHHPHERLVPHTAFAVLHSHYFQQHTFISRSLFASK